MEFKTRMSNTFIMNLFMIALALLMASFSLFNQSPQNGIINYIYILWLFIAYVRLRIYLKYINLMIFRRPVLIVNETCIHDLAKKIKYYWKDIDTVHEDNAYLYIKVYKPAEYLSKIGGPLKRFIKGLVSNPFNTPFIININMVDVNPDLLLTVLDNYSKEETENEKWLCSLLNKTIWTMN